MSEPVRFLGSFAQALATMVLYQNGHPARERAVDQSFDRLRELQQTDAHPQFTFLGQDVIYGQRALREMKEWDWGVRLANAGVQRLEIEADVSREEYEGFLEEILARVTLAFVDTTTSRPGARSSIRFGAIGVRGASGAISTEEDALPTATIKYSLGEEADTVRWMHDEVQLRGQLPLIEAEAVVRSLSVAMHADSEIVIPLVQLKEFDQYTTTHSINVSVLAMALAEFLGLGAQDVRAFGVAGLLHDLGKVRIPKDVLTKKGRLTEEEWSVMRRHPVEGAKIIVESDRQLDLAAVVAYEHHIMLNGGGYPGMHFHRDCHQASKLVHVCDVYDALRTKRPYRDAWESEKALEYMEGRVGTDFDPEIMKAFSTMMQEWDRRPAEFEAPPAATDGAAVTMPEEAPPSGDSPGTGGESGRAGSS